MIYIDYKNRSPIYEQVIAEFENLIVKGVLQPDEKLPSVRSLAMELSINPNTIQRAYHELERNGYIYTVKGKGNFVAAKENFIQTKHEELWNSLRGLIKDAKGAGISKEEIRQRIELFLREDGSND
ncbi:GntR family transcriptional regulator [Anaeromicropila populeti]|uniref:Transcriptional regulator, GntR family n=1 Tax=Anaeromicropila populeti TaxID=37658 RepID=A0A1I6LJC4_9FIRM|nr:GntR family transcriptional regulator [Anaeromicropila populeti]SFS03585.1 transcriptional regulator, GntR family [Anaeromicropila populeti]